MNDIEIEIEKACIEHNIYKIEEYEKEVIKLLHSVRALKVQQTTLLKRLEQYI